MLAMPEVRPAAKSLLATRGRGRARVRATASLTRSLRRRSGSSRRSARSASFTLATLHREGAKSLGEATIFGEYSLLVNQWLVRGLVIGTGQMTGGCCPGSLVLSVENRGVMFIVERYASREFGFELVRVDA